MNYIDAHVHVWTEDIASYPLASGFTREDMDPAHFPPEEILAHARPCGVDRIVLVQMSYYRFDNSYMLEVMREYEGVFAGIAIVDPEEERPDEEMRDLAGMGVRGFRIAPWGSPVESWLEGAGYERMFRAGADGNLALCPLIDVGALPSLARRCEEFSETPVIIDHLCRIGAGGPITERQIDALCRMAQYPRVMVKVSAFYALGAKKPPYRDLSELIRRVCEAFGPERLMWASDCPFQVQGEHTYAGSIGLIREGLDFLSEGDKEQLLRGTAEAFFFAG